MTTPSLDQYYQNLNFLWTIWNFRGQKVLDHLANYGTPVFETQRSHHQKPETAASVAPQKGLMSSKN